MSINETDLVIRKSDGLFFEASFDPVNPLRHLFSGGYWYFKHVIKQNKKWWQFWKSKWKRTGIIWVTRNPDDFDLYIMDEPTEHKRFF